MPRFHTLPAETTAGANRRVAAEGDMPSLFRLLLFVGLVGGLGYAAVFSLANFVSYHPREIIVTIPPDKFVKQPH